VCYFFTAAWKLGINSMKALVDGVGALFIVEDRFDYLGRPCISGLEEWAETHLSLQPTPLMAQ